LAYFAGDISFGSNVARSVPESLTTVTKINKKTAFLPLTKQIVTICRESLVGSAERVE
jgi:hypothetical protein